jgi:hypothetical protein
MFKPVSLPDFYTPETCNPLVPNVDGFFWQMEPKSDILKGPMRHTLLYLSAGNQSLPASIKTSNGYETHFYFNPE